MKLLKFTSLVFSFTSMLCVATLQASSSVVNNTAMVIVKDAVLGSWDYFVSDVEPAYSKGIMHVTKIDGEYAVNIELPNGTIPTEDVKVNGNEIKYALYVEGMRVSVTVRIDGDTLSGSGETDQGSFTLTGTRRK